MKVVKGIIGIIFIIAGIVLGAYLGIWVMLIGGIIQIVNAVQASPVSGSDIAYGVVKIIFCELPGIITYIFIVIGGAIMGINIRRKNKRRY